MDTISASTTAGTSVAYTGTAGSTGVFAATVTAVMCWATTDCYIIVGEGVTATTSDTPVPSYTPMLFTVPKGTGANWRVSAIQISTGGTLYVKPVSGVTA